MMALKIALPSPRNEKSNAARGERSTRISEAAAMRILQYRNGFRLFYRCCCYSPAYAWRKGHKCPWWAFPRSRAVSPAMYSKLVKAVNLRRVS